VEQGLAAGYVADAHRIRQVLNNLVSNAVKFTESGRIILRVKSAPPRTLEAARLRFEIIDSGIGMTEQQRMQVFQSFSQADASISRRFGGSGLGLTLCQQLSDLMGGSIEVQSTPFVGSVFSVELPVAIDELAHGEDPSLLAKQRIALLSTSSEWRIEISSLLSSLGADVVTAALPSELDPDWVAQSDALVIFGACHAWLGEEQDALMAGATRVVQATTDGPLVPQLRDGIRFISCYSSGALLSALLDMDPNSEPDGQKGIYGRAGIQLTGGCGSVLLADDNPVNRELIQQQLETLGYTVDAAEDGIVALRLWQEGRYDIVLTDINMPNMNGYELTKQLRARGATVPILAVTATALTSEKVHCKHAGINELLLKPLSLEHLGEALSRHLVSADTASAPLVKVAWARKYPEKVCRIFVESGTRDLNAILEAARGRDQEGLLARIHSVKGALLMLGEQDVAAQCATLEKWIEVDGVEVAGPGIERLASAMRELLQRYAEFV
jgi:two-component system, NarL family, capsular synthesis sensor histidine kinase RcsC